MRQQILLVASALPSSGELLGVSAYLTPRRRLAHPARVLKSPLRPLHSSVKQPLYFLEANFLITLKRTYVVL